jgi:hypothetical protein
LGDPPLKRGWTPRELRRLRDEDPERYREVIKDLNKATGDATQTFRAMLDAMREPPWITALGGRDDPPDDEPEPEPAPVRRKRQRQGKTYPADAVAAVILRVRDEQPSRHLRDEVHRELVAAMPAATTTLIDHVLTQMGGRRLSKTRRRQWTRTAERIVGVDGSVTLDELTKRLK